MKYIRIPIVVEAVQFLKDNNASIEAVETLIGQKVKVCGQEIYFRTLNRWPISARHLSWIMKGEDGDFTVCRSEEFRNNYEPMRANEDGE